ncbi:MAG TPA: hypothetical protein VGL19_14910 [Polyangiaceae bacterium]
MRLGWLVSAGFGVVLAACSSSNHKKVLYCDAAVCNPVDEAGAAGAATGPDTGPGAAGEGGTANGPDASAEGGAPPEPDAGSEAGAPGEGGVAPGSQLEVTLAGNGSVAVTDAAACLAGSCDYPFGDGTVLTLEAKPGPDSRFVGWSGACSGSDAKTMVTVSGLKACIATFAVQRVVSATVDVAGTGTVSSNPNLGCSALGCSGQVDDHSSVTLNATAAQGFRFVSWTGSPECNGSTQGSLAILVTENVSCTAKFSKQFLLSVSGTAPAAQVSVSSGACLATMCTADAGANATFTAGQVAGFRFTGWSGDAACTGTVDPLQVSNIASDISCVANYAARFKVTGLVGSGLAGAVTATSGDVNATCSTNACIVDSGTNTTLVAPTIAGYRLTGWTGAGCTGAQNGNGLVVSPTTGDLTCTATYAKGVSVTGTVVGATGNVVAASSSAGATCPPGSGGCALDAGGNVTLTAPNLLPTYRFVNWAGDPGCMGGALAITLSNVTTSAACRAIYVQQFTIAGKANPGGTASAAAGGNACAGNSCTVDAGAPVTLTAAPDTANGFHFSNWTGAGCTPAANNPLVLSNVNTTCTANFALNTFTIAATAGTNGAVTATRSDTAALCANASCTVNFGTTVTLAATPAAHFHFVSWAGAGCAPTTTASITLKNLNATCSAAFAIDTFAATVSAQPAAAATVGITCPGNNCAAVGYGQLVNVTAAANAGWSFSGWSANCNGGTASPNAVTVIGTTACVATFRPRVTGTVAPSAAAGSITATGNPNAVCVNGSSANCIVDSGGSVTLTAVPAASSVFVSWSGGCAGTATAVTLNNVTGPVNCTANFYQLWAQASGAAGEEDMTNVTVLADGTVVGAGPSQLVGSRMARLALVDLDANTGKLGRNQLFADSKPTGVLAPIGIAATSNQKNIIALGVHRSVGVSQNAWLRNEQAPAWEFEYAYPNTGLVSGVGNVIATKDGGYAFVVAVNENKIGVRGHLTKLDASGAVKFDTAFYVIDPTTGALVNASPVDLLEDPAGKYFAVLSSYLVGQQEQIMLTFINEDGSFNGAAHFVHDVLSVFPTRFVVGAHADTFLVTGQMTDVNGSEDGFYAELPKATGKQTFAFSIGNGGSYENLKAVAVTPKGYALAGDFINAANNDQAWLVQTDAAGAVTSESGYGSTGGELAEAVFVPPAGGLVLAGSTRSWGAGLGDMWTLRLNAAGGITFNAASAAVRSAPTYARTAISLNSATITVTTLATTVTQVAPTEVVTTPNFAQNQQAP